VELLGQHLAQLEPLLFSKDQGVLADRRGWVDAFLAPSRQTVLIPDSLRQLLTVPIDDEALRAFLRAEGEAAMSRIETLFRPGRKSTKPLSE
jgi:hypothetical protein